MSITPESHSVSSSEPGNSGKLKRNVLIGAGVVAVIAAAAVITPLIFGGIPTGGTQAMTPSDDEYSSQPVVGGWTSEPMNDVKEFFGKDCLTFKAASAGKDLALILTSAEACEGNDGQFTATLVNTQSGKRLWATDLKGAGITEQAKYRLEKFTDGFIYLAASSSPQPLISLDKASGKIVSSVKIDGLLTIDRVPGTTNDIFVTLSDESGATGTFSRHAAGNLEKPVWKTAMPKCWSLVVAAGRIIGMDGEAQDLATGETAKKALSAQGCPIQVEGNTVFNSYNLIEGFNKGGSQTWSKKSMGQVNTASAWDTLSFGVVSQSNTSLFVLDKGTLIKLDPRTGAEGARLAGVADYPIIIETDRAYVVITEGTIGYDKSGKKLWSLGKGQYIAGISKNVIYFYDVDNGLQGYDINNGEKLWTLPLKKDTRTQFLGGHLVELNMVDGSLSQYKG